jgi:hypothetical protein
MSGIYGQCGQNGHIVGETTEYNAVITPFEGVML